MSHGLVPGRAAMGWSVYEAFVLSPTGQAGRLCACTLSWLVPEGKVTSLLGGYPGFQALPATVSQAQVDGFGVVCVWWAGAGGHSARPASCPEGRGWAKPPGLWV